MRRIPFIFIALLLLVALLVIFRDRIAGLRRAATADTSLPVDLRSLLPANWTVVPNKYHPCDYDGDGETEYLVIYSYDQTTVTGTVGVANMARSQIGGVIYDAQPNRPPQVPGNESPYRPGYMTPYRLLPDLFPGKGQGFLGESDVTLSYSPGPQTEATCSVGEIAVFGYSDNDRLPTRLSLFAWGGPDRGYLSQHFVGNARLLAQNAPNLTQPIQDVTTFNRFNDRSQLCYARRYQRKEGEPLSFAQTPENYTVDFCFGAPADPAYPEAVVVALLRGYNPPTDPANTPPAAGSFFATEAITATNFPTELADLRNAERAPRRILALSNPGTLTGLPGPGVAISATGQTWIVGEERVPITATVEINGAPRETVWELVSVANERIRADVRWRITRLGLR